MLAPRSVLQVNVGLSYSSMWVCQNMSITPKFNIFDHLFLYRPTFLLPSLTQISWQHDQFGLKFFLLGKNEAHGERVWVGVYHENFSILGWVYGMSKNNLKYNGKTDLK